MRSRIAVLLFFAGPAALVAFAVSLRTAGVVDSHAAIEAREREAARAARR